MVQSVSREMTGIQRRAGFLGAGLLVLGLLMGGLISASMGGQLPIDEEAARGAHVNGILGSLWLAALASTLPLTRFSPSGARTLVHITFLVNVSNVLVTAGKGFFHVAGVGLTASLANNVVFAILTITVVIPGLAAAVAWTWGFGASEA